MGKVALGGGLVGVAVLWVWREARKCLGGWANEHRVQVVELGRGTKASFLSSSLMIAAASTTGLLAHLLSGGATEGRAVIAGATVALPLTFLPALVAVLMVRTKLLVHNLFLGVGGVVGVISGVSGR